MSEFIAPSGAKVVINLAPWKDAKELKKAIEKEISIDNAFDAEHAGDTMLTNLLKLDCSHEVEAVLYPCLARCTRDGQKIIEATFDSEEGRQDYYDIVTACVKENLRPLVEGLLSKLSELGILKKQANQKDGPALKSPTI